MTRRHWPAWALWLSRGLGRLLRAALPATGRRAPAVLADAPARGAALAEVPPPALTATAYVSVVIPALNEAECIAGVVAFALADAATAEVIVIDDSSLDDTAWLAAQAGARVVTSTLLGKGASMQDGAREAAREIVVYMDGDLSGLRPGLVGRLCQPLLADQADFVKARFERGGGRVTELTAKPMLKVFFPELAHFSQPLGGIIAARRSLLRQLPFEDGYGVDVGLLIDAQRSGARLAEVDVGPLQHDSQPLQDLTAMANEVSRVIYARARTAGRLHVDQIVTMYEAQAQAAASLDYVLSRRRGRLRLLLLDMHAIVAVGAAAMHLLPASAAAWMPTTSTGLPDARARVSAQAAQLRFVHRQQLEEAARGLPLRPGVVEFVNRMRRSGFMVGVIGHGFFVLAEVLRRRVFADFALAHLLQFDGDVCTGQVRLNPALQADASDADSALCKSHLLQRFRDERASGLLLECWAIGNHEDDLRLLQAADTAFALEPVPAALRQLPGLRRIDSFDDLLDLVPQTQPRQTSSHSLRT